MLHCYRAQARRILCLLSVEGPSVVCPRFHSAGKVLSRSSRYCRVLWERLQGFTCLFAELMLVFAGGPTVAEGAEARAFALSGQCRPGTSSPTARCFSSGGLTAAASQAEPVESTPGTSQRAGPPTPPLYSLSLQQLLEILIRLLHQWKAFSSVKCCCIKKSPASWRISIVHS